jgi:hypothetical protein
MANTTKECKHANVTHTDGWPAGTVGGQYVFAPSDRCDDCGAAVETVTDDAGNTVWSTV